MNRSILGLLLSLACLAGFSCGGPNSETSQPPGPQPGAPAKPAVAAVPLASYKVEWISNQIPSEMQAGKQQIVTVNLKNAGTAAWPSKGTDGTANNQVSVSYHWLPAQGDTPVVVDGLRTPLPRDIGPGEAVTINNVTIEAPPAAGTYRLQMTLVHEMVTWFETQDAKTLTVPVKVQ